MDFSAFSRPGLIGQLEFEGFSTADATHAVDSLNVDWNAQAAQAAADYLDFTAFSRSGLIDPAGVVGSRSTRSGQIGFAVR